MIPGMSEDVLFEKTDDGVGLITLNRPDSLNAMGGRLIPMLGEALSECERRREVRCVAVTGAGRGFCAGGDVKGMVAGQRGEGGDGERPSFAQMLEETLRGLRDGQDNVSLRLHTMPKPTVALVNGPAAGAGMSVALAADIRFCSDRARFVPAFAKVGLSGDFGGSYLLPKLIGFGKARELYFLSETIDAARALELGIANHVVPHDELMEKGIEYCTRLAKGPTAVYARMKANFTLGESVGFAEALDQEALNMRLSGMAKDFREGTRAFVEKRDPAFTGE